MFGRAKTIHSAAVWENTRDGKLYSININGHSPQFKEDFWTLQFLRTYCDCIITTGKILRAEPMAFNPDVLQMLKLPKAAYFKENKKRYGKLTGNKPVAILTKDINKNIFVNDGGDSANQVYYDPRFKKHILVRPNVKERYERYEEGLQVEEDDNHQLTNTTIEPIENLSLQNSIDYLRQKYGYEQILVECGVSTTKEYYEPLYSEDDPDYVGKSTPFDLLYLSIFRGKLHPSCVGPIFPGFDAISERLNVV